MLDIGREKSKKFYLKIYYYKRKSLSNHLINHVEDLENICLNKKIFKYFQKYKLAENKYIKSFFFFLIC